MTASVTGDGLVSARINPEARVISLVIPSFNESANVVELLARLDVALPAQAPCEVIFVDDSMSGFFAVRATALDADVLRPLGYKILLELIVRCRLGRVAEGPYQFQNRFAGESEANFGEGLRFLRHLLVLRVSSVSSSLTRLARPGRRTAPPGVHEVHASEVQ